MAEPKKVEESDAKAITAIAGALAIGASAQATANSLSTVLGIPVPSLLPVLLLAMSRPISYGVATLPSASATRESSALEATYRAQYVLAASRRVQAVISGGGSVQDAMRRERTYFDQHMNAVQNRQKGAVAVDQAARRFGSELGWYAKMDAKTSEECREANGRNFVVSRVPPIGYPGTVHPHCRCKPGKAHTTSKTVYSVKPADHGRAA